MKSAGTLTFFCGKMGAGKSTKSQQLHVKKNSVLLSEDTWLSSHFPEQILTFDDYIKYSNRIKPFVKAHVQAILKAGVDVIMDFPANTINQRKWFKELFTEIDADHELIFLDLSDEECLAHIAKRRLEEPERAHFDTEEIFREVTKKFQTPSIDETFNIIKIT